MKFGGGCLRSPSDFRRVSNILESFTDPIIVVVSAVYGVTNKLESAAQSALDSEEAISPIITDLRDQHFEIAASEIQDPEEYHNTSQQLDRIFDKIERLLYGLAYIGEIFEPIRILLLSQGERLSSVLLAGILRSYGNLSVSLESEQIGLVTDACYDNATANLSAIKMNLLECIPAYLEQGCIPVITGFFGCTETGRVTSFGRNGSDYSTSVIAHALGAKTIDIWKDVDGFMTADPRLVSHSVPIETLSYREAAELSYFGARVLHPRTVEPLIGTFTEVFVRNVHNPSSRGTLIQCDGHEHHDVIKSVTYNLDIAVLKIHGAGVGHKPGIIGDIGDHLSAERINIYSVITSQTCINLIIDAKDASRSKTSLQPLVGGVIEKLELRIDVALIAVVGEGLLSTKGLAAKVFSAVAAEGINVEMFSAGASEVAYYFIVKKNQMRSAIESVHRQFFAR